MKNKLFEEAIKQVPKEITEKIQQYTDMIDDISKIFNMEQKINIWHITWETETGLKKSTFFNSGFINSHSIIYHYFLDNSQELIYDLKVKRHENH